jgi:hypothetical protein
VRGCEWFARESWVECSRTTMSASIVQLHGATRFTMTSDTSAGHGVEIESMSILGAYFRTTRKGNI